MDRVVHFKKSKYDVYIGRPSKWGNPFSIGVHGTRDQVIEKYKVWVLGQDELMDSIQELEGKVLGCWCSPSACHGDFLVELADSYNLYRKYLLGFLCGDTEDLIDCDVLSFSEWYVLECGGCVG